MQERRQHDRIPIRAEVQLVQSGRVEHMTARDLSVGGAFLETTLFDHIELRTGSHCEITLYIEENRPLHACEDGHIVHAHARIVRRDPGGPEHPSGLGVVFEHMDLDTVTRLQALVSQNP